MNFFEENRLLATRRQLLTSVGTGLGAAALSSLLNSANTQASDRASASAVAADSLGGLPDLPHISPKIKNVIYLFQNGAPTHVDLFDWKPKLKMLHGEPVPMSYIGDRRFSTMTGNADGKCRRAECVGRSGTGVAATQHDGAIGSRTQNIAGRCHRDATNEPVAGRVARASGEEIFCPPSTCRGSG